MIKNPSIAKEEEFATDTRALKKVFKPSKGQLGGSGVKQV
jgi:hypothetical protein